MKEKNYTFINIKSEDRKGMPFRPSLFVAFICRHLECRTLVRRPLECRPLVCRPLVCRTLVCRIMVCLIMMCILLCGCGNEGVLISSGEKNDLLQSEKTAQIDSEGSAKDGRKGSAQVGRENPAQIDSEGSAKDALEGSARNGADDIAGEAGDGSETGSSNRVGDTAEKIGKYSTVVVYVCGQVAEPGVYELQEGSRVVDGIASAGGFTAEACPEVMNLSAVMRDSQRIYVPSVEEAKDGRLGANALMQGDGGMTWGDITSGESAGDREMGETAGDFQGKININTADENTLTRITGIGATRAKSIIKYRESHGGFKKIEDIMNVSGIGEASFQKMKDMITVE